MIDHLRLSYLFSLSYNQKPVLGNQTNSSIVMKGWYKTFFPNISNGEFSCSDHFSFVKGHYELYVHIKQRCISLGEYIRITGPLIIFPWCLNICSRSLCYVFYCWHSNGIEPRVFWSEEEKGQNWCKPKEPVIVSDNFPMWLLPHPSCQSLVIRNKVLFMINALG